MSEKMVTVQLPESTFHKLKRASEITRRSIDDILVSTVNAALIAPPHLSPDLAAELATMHLFSDEALWAATHPSLFPTEQDRLYQLNHYAGERPLTPAEAAEQSTLIEKYQRSFLRRAQALAILAQRGP